MNDDAMACSEADQVYGFAIGALPSAEARDFAAHLSMCASCVRDLDVLRPVITAFGSWPSDILRPSPALWDRLSERINQDGAPAAVPRTSTRAPRKAEWKEVSPGISCKVLATDEATARVSMLVRLQPGISYPPHRHADREELHLLHGELWVDDRKLYPGDYYCAEPGTADSRVWSETGCTCVLVTSLNDRLA
jgi:anti-sigma factor ChrR (cupin superfamily)